MCDEWDVVRIRHPSVHDSPICGITAVIRWFRERRRQRLRSDVGAAVESAAAGAVARRTAGGDSGGVDVEGWLMEDFGRGEGGGGGFVGFVSVGGGGSGRRDTWGASEFVAARASAYAWRASGVYRCVGEWAVWAAGVEGEGWGLG